MRNWRPISLQLTCYKLYAAIIARRVASWATATSSFVKGFLAYDGCSEHNFLLRSMITNCRRKRKEFGPDMAGHQGGNSIGIHTI